MAIFADQLGIILQKHGLTLSSLDRSPYGIHPAVISRLMSALKSGSPNPVLSVTELERLQKQIPLDMTEMRLLHNAVMATAIERQLSATTDPKSAERVAYLIFQLLLKAKFTDKSIPNVFLSHASVDKGLAIKVASDLRMAGIDVWVDIDDIAEGSFMDRINEGLRKCNWLVVLVTPSALRASGVIMEVNAALELVRQDEMLGVIPFVVEHFDPKDMPPLWRPLHRYDATENYEDGLSQLLRVFNPPT